MTFTVSRKNVEVEFMPTNNNIRSMQFTRARLWTIDCENVSFFYQDLVGWV